MTGQGYDPIVTLVDGEPVGAIAVTDSSVLRGDGCFEAIRSYRGRLFRAADHLDRLERSAAALQLTLPDRGVVRGWMERVVPDGADCIVRVVLTRGGAVPGAPPGERCVVLSHPLPGKVGDIRLWPVAAPWHPAGREWDLAGVKTISYAPNLAATRRALSRGAHDALLISDRGLVLEGPTYAIGWCRDNRLYTPALRLGILDSITTRVVRELRPDIQEAEADLAELEAADEVFAMSTVKEVVPVVGVGEAVFAPGPLTRQLAQRFGELVGQPETGPHPR